MPTTDPEAPVRLCCFQRHYGLVCPDGKVMCELCYGRFAIEELALDDDGNRWDVCQACDEADKAAVARRARGK